MDKVIKDNRRVATSVQRLAIMFDRVVGHYSNLESALLKMTYTCISLGKKN